MLTTYYKRTRCAQIHTPVPTGLRYIIFNEITVQHHFCECKQRAQESDYLFMGVTCTTTFPWNPTAIFFPTTIIISFIFLLFNNSTMFVNTTLVFVKSTKIIAKSKYYIIFLKTRKENLRSIKVWNGCIGIYKLVTSIWRSTRQILMRVSTFLHIIWKDEACIWCNYICLSQDYH